MFCPNCGGQVADGGKFCTVCGTVIAQMPVSQTPQMMSQAPIQQTPQAPVQQIPQAPAQQIPQAPVQQIPQTPVQQISQDPLQTVVVAKKKKKLWLIPVIIGGSIIIIAAVIAVVVLAMENSPAKKYENKLRIAEEYISDLDYEEAIAAYKEAISIKPGDAEAYLGLAQIYADMAEECVEAEEYDDALDYYIEAISVLTDGKKKCGDDNKLEKREKKYNKRYQEIDTLKREAARAGSEENTDGGSNVSETNQQGNQTTEPEIVEVNLIDEFCERLAGCWVSDNRVFVEISVNGTVLWGIFFSDGMISYTITDVEFDGEAYTVSQYYHIEQSEIYDEEEGTVVNVYSSNDGFNNVIIINGTEYIKMGDSADEVMSYM